MAVISDIGRLLQRCETVGLGGKRTKEVMSDLVNEWLNVLGVYNAELLDQALTEYIANDTRVYARLPKAGELRQICDNILEERQRRQGLDFGGKCPLCHGFKQVLVQARPEALFYGHYVDLGIKCPCQRAGETPALRQGLKITRRLKSGYLEMWLKHERLFGRLKEYDRKEPAVFAEPVGQQSLKSAFDDLPF